MSVGEEEEEEEDGWGCCPPAQVLKRSNSRQRTPSAIRELKQQQQQQHGSSQGRLVGMMRGFRRVPPVPSPPLVVFPRACLDHDTHGHQESSDRLRYEARAIADCQ